MHHKTAISLASSALRAGFIAVVLVVLAMAGPSRADAAARAFTNSYAQTLHGDIATIGNANSTCKSTAPAWTTCTPAALGSHNSNEGYGTLIDIDGAAVNTTNSSTSSLSLPTGAVVRSARLVWASAGDGTDGNGEATVRFDGPSAGYNYTNVTAAAAACGSIANATGANTRGFACSADVTASVAAAGAGAYTVGGIEQRLTTGGDLPDHWSGWNLYVVYELATEPLRRLVLSDGFQRVQTGAATTITATGFVAPASGSVAARLIYSVGEGDSGIAGDNATFGSQSLDTVAPIDLMESTIRGLDYEASRAPSNLNNYGFDLHDDDVNGAIGNGATSAAFVFNTTQDVYYPFSLGIAIDLGEPNLVLTKTLTDLNGGVVEPGDILRYQIVAENQGNDGAAAVTITDPIPANTTYVPGTMTVSAGANAGVKTDAAGDDQGTFAAGTGPNGTVTMRLGAGANGTTGGVLAAGGGTSTLTFQVRIAAGADEGVPLTNTASGSYIGQTSLLSYADPSSVAATPVRRADMVIGQTLSTATMTNGAPATVTLTATNAGGAQTYGQPVTVTSTLPAGIAVSGIASSPGWTCNVAGQTVTCTRTDALLAGDSYPAIVIDVTPSQTITSATFTASVAGGNEVRTTNNTDSDPATFSRSANLRIAKTVNTATARVGDVLTYTIVATNLGPSNTTGVVVTDPLPTTLQPLTGSTTQGTCTTTGQNLSCAVGALASGASATITATARVLPAGVASTITNAASISGADPDPTPANNTSSDSTQIGQAADLQVTKAVAPTTINPGSDATWTVTVRNNGPGTATAAQVVDDLPSGIAVQSITPSQGTCGTGDPFTCTLGSLASGAMATVVVVARPILASAGTTLTNTADVSTTAWDPTAGNDKASAALQVSPAADLRVVKTADKATANVDELITWTVTLTNDGPSPAAGATITDTAPAGVTIQAVTPPAGVTCSTAGQTISCAAGTLASGASRAVTITARVNRASAGSPLSNSATGASSTFDPDNANNLSTVTTSVNNAADLRVTKTADRTTARVGDLITWTVTATNDGASPATGVQLTDVLPAGVTLTGAAPQASQGPACTVISGQVVCAIGTLAVNATATFTLTARVERAAAETPLQNVAQITGAEFDPDTANNSTTVSSPVPATSDLRVTKTVSNTTRNVGDTLAYTITATNDGPSTATNVTVADALPAGFQMVGAPTIVGGPGACAPGTSYTCTFASIANGGTRTITINGIVTAAGAGTTLSNTATISGNQVDQDPTNNSSTPVTTNVGGVADLSITKSVDASTANVGGTLTYTLVVRNTGPQAATGTVVTDTLPAGLTRLGATATQGSCPAGSPIVCNLGTIPVGGQATITITASVGLGAAGTTATNSASVTGTLDDLTTTNNTATASTTIAPAADLRIVKTSDRSTADVGETITWTLTATNDGPSAASGITVNDTIPSGVALQTPITGLPAGVTCTPSGQVVGCTIAGSLASGASRVITLRGTVQRAAAETPQENVATIGGSQLDPNTANNTSRVTTNPTAAADLRVVKTANVATANVGQTITWTVAVTNDGPSIATGVQLIDDLPAGTTLLTRTVSQGTCTATAAQVLCAVGTLAPGQTATATITARVERANAESPVNNVGRATGAQFDPDTANNISTATTTVGPSTDLQLTMVVDKPNANVGETVTYDVVVRNDGPSTATGVVFTDTLPSTLQRTGTITASGGGTCTTAGQAISCLTGTLASGATVTYRFQAIVLATGAASTITNTANVTGTQNDPTPADNTASAATTVPGSADVSVVTSVDQATASVGDTLTYTFTARNDGPQTATGFQLVGNVPAGLTVLTSSAPGLTCSGAPITCTGALPVGATATLTVTARVNTAASGQTLTAAGTVSATPFDPTPLNNTDDAVTTVRPAADLQISKSADRSSANLGDLITYTLRADNAGPAAATGVIVTDTVPSTLQIVGTPTSTIGACTVAGQAVTCTPGSIASGAFATITIVGRVLSSAAGTTVANTASIDGAQDDPTPANDTSLPTSTVVAGAADVAVVTSVDQATANVGDVLTYTFVATNNGPQPATGFTLQGTLPPGFTIVGTPTATGGLTCSGNPVSCTGTLANGASSTLTVQARAGVSTSGTTATALGVVSATPYDAVPANNADDAVTTIRPAADLRATKTVNSASANIGDVLVYTLRVDNAGPAAATGVTLTDTLPSTLQLVGTPTASQGICAVSGQTITCSPGNVASGANATATVNARVLGSASGTTVSNAVTVDGDQFDQTPGNDTSPPATTAVGSVADVGIVTSVDKATANVGETLTYTFVATNNGPQTAAGFTLQGTIPPGLTIVGTPTITGGLTCSGSPISCVGSLPTGGTATLTVRATVPTSASGSTVTALGVVSATPFDPNSSNNANNASTTIRPAADLRATKTADKSSANVGELITYTLTASNSAPMAQLTAWPLTVQVPCEAAGVPTSCSVLGSVSVSVTPVAFAGPELLAVRG